MEWGRVVVTDLLPGLVGDNAELAGGKPKILKRKSKPYSQPGLNHVDRLANLYDSKANVVYKNLVTKFLVVREIRAWFGDVHLRNHALI
jgi:hypothetical protein